MSYIFDFSQKCAFALALLVCFLSSLGCDPCRQLSEKMCDCQRAYEEEYGEEKKKQCKSDLNLAPQHANFKDAKETKACQKALKHCTCPDLLSGNGRNCGSFRLD